MADYEQAVFISYAWGAEREDIVNQIDESLQKRGIKIIRDKRALGYKGSIKEFMERIGQGHCVIVVISDKYLRSPNCMFELVEIADNKQFHDRVYPIVLSDANIYDPLKRIEYVKHWEAKRAELAKAMKKLDPANLQGIRDDMDQYDRIRDKISGITSILKDMNTLTPEMHRDSEFKDLYDAIVNRMKKGQTGTFSTADMLAQKQEFERLAAQNKAKVEADQLAVQKAEEERVALAKAEADRKAKEESDRLAAQKAQAKAKPVEPKPINTKAEEVSAAPAKKKPAYKGIAIGIGAVVILCIVVGLISSLGGGTSPSVDNSVTQAPAATEASPAESASNPSLIFVDDFTDSNVSYSNWGDVSPSYFENGKLYLVTPDGSNLRYSPATIDFSQFGPDLAVQASLTPASITGSGVFCRLQDGAFYLFAMDFDNALAQIFYYDGSTFNLLAEQSVALSSDYNYIYAVCQGNSLSLYWNGGFVVGATHDALPGPGQVGVFIGSSNPSGATVEVDDFAVAYPP